MMKPTLALLCVVATISSIPCAVSANAFSEKSRFDRRSQMQPLRRLGLLPVVHNVVDARKNLADQTTLRGIVAQPLSVDDFSQKFNEVLKSVSDASGRFWTLDVIPSEGAAGRLPSGEQMSSFQRAQLVNEYDLDGWLRAEVYFSADHTAVKLTLMGAQLKPVVAREDILLPYGADWDAVANAFAQTLGRMAETIGHDGRVVFENGELMGIDFGTERGLSNGQRLKAGLVVQSAVHPQTGEVLRYQRHSLYELEVVDAKQGASLCRKISVEPELLRQAESAYGSGTDRKFQMLVWRDTQGSTTPTAGTAWKSVSSSTVRADSSSAGFTPRETPIQQQGLLQSPAVISPGQKPVARDNTPPVPATNVASAGLDGFAMPSFKRDSGSLFSTMKFSAGASNGTLELSKGPVNSSLPALLVNTFSLQDGFRYGGEWNIKYGAEYAMFGGSMNGSRFTFRGGGFAPAQMLQLPDFPLNWGLEAQYSSGSVSTERSKKNFDAFELFGAVGTERLLEGGWGIAVDYKQSMTGLLAGAFGFEAGIEVHPGSPAPKELAINWRYINDGDRWTEWLLGASWKLGAVE